MTNSNGKSWQSYNGQKIAPFGVGDKFASGRHVRGWSVQEVQVTNGNGGILEFDMREGELNVIFNKVHRKWYILAEETPICKGSLRGQFGYISTLPPAWSVLDGSYDFPLDIDKATKELFEECAKIRSKVPANSVTGDISREHWQLAMQMEKGEGGYLLVPVRASLWTLH